MAATKPATKPSVQPDALAASLQRFGLERDRMRAALSRSAGITATDLDALEHLEADGPLTQRDLGIRLSLTSGAITMLVDRLEGAGWVRRRPHPVDRRYVLLELSPKALEGMPPALVDYHAAIRALAAKVPPAQRKAVRAFLRDAADAASTAAAELGTRNRRE
jgi:DNA-binding MarR family transcriptional regulator